MSWFLPPGMTIEEVVALEMARREEDANSLLRMFPGYPIEEIEQATRTGQGGRLVVKRCFYCGTGPGSEREHKIPLARGGLNIRQNVVPSCRKCNSEKSAKTVDEYRQHIMRHAGKSEHVFYGEMVCK